MVPIPKRLGGGGGGEQRREEESIINREIYDGGYMSKEEFRKLL